MRLIDADKLLERIEEITRTQMMKVLVESWINEQPTAYKVDKVVEQLEEKSQLVRPYGWVYPYEVILTKDVMKIVKAGGIDD